MIKSVGILSNDSHSFNSLALKSSKSLNFFMESLHTILEMQLHFTWILFQGMHIMHNGKLSHWNKN